jgi:hypothetical protein
MAAIRHSMPSCGALLATHAKGPSKVPLDGREYRRTDGRRPIFLRRNWQNVAGVRINAACNCVDTYSGYSRPSRGEKPAGLVSRGRKEGVEEEVFDASGVGHMLPLYWNRHVPRGELLSLREELVLGKFGGCGRFAHTACIEDFFLKHMTLEMCISVAIYRRHLS